MGGRAGGGALGGGGGMSDSAIARMAKDFVPFSAIDVSNTPSVLNGEILIDSVTANGNRVWTGARISSIEQQIEKDAGKSPEPKYGKNYPKYVAAYNAYHAKYVVAMNKGIASYKQQIAKTKNPALKSLLAARVVKYQGWLKDSYGVKDWINKSK